MTTVTSDPFNVVSAGENDEPLNRRGYSNFGNIVLASGNGALFGPSSGILLALSANGTGLFYTKADFVYTFELWKGATKLDSYDWDSHGSAPSFNAASSHWTGLEWRAPHDAYLNADGTVGIISINDLTAGVALQEVYGGGLLFEFANNALSVTPYNFIAAFASYLADIGLSTWTSGLWTEGDGAFPGWGAGVGGYTIAPYTRLGTTSSFSVPGTSLDPHGFGGGANNGGLDYTFIDDLTAHLTPEGGSYSASAGVVNQTGVSHKAAFTFTHLVSLSGAITPRSTNVDQNGNTYRATGYDHAVLTVVYRTRVVELTYKSATHAVSALARDFAPVYVMTNGFAGNDSGVYSYGQITDSAPASGEFNATLSYLYESPLHGPLSMVVTNGAAFQKKVHIYSQWTTIDYTPAFGSADFIVQWVPRENASDLWFIAEFFGEANRPYYKKFVSGAWSDLNTGPHFVYDVFPSINNAIDYYFDFETSELVALVNGIEVARLSIDPEYSLFSFAIPFLNLQLFKSQTDQQYHVILPSRSNAYLIYSRTDLAQAIALSQNVAGDYSLSATGVLVAKPFSGHGQGTTLLFDMMPK